MVEAAIGRPAFRNRVRGENRRKGAIGGEKGAPGVLRAGQRPLLDRGEGGFQRRIFPLHDLAPCRDFGVDADQEVGFGAVLFPVKTRLCDDPLTPFRMFVRRADRPDAGVDQGDVFGFGRAGRTETEWRCVFGTLFYTSLRLLSAGGCDAS